NKKNSKLIIKNKKLKLPKNIEFFNPQNVRDFKDFMQDKNIIAINSFGRAFNDLKIHFLFKYFNIKQIQISDLGPQHADIFPKTNYDIIAWFNKFNHDFGHIITVALSNFGLVPKIDIRFISNKKIFKVLKKNSLFKKLNLFYCKKHILINGKAYDYIASNNPKILEKKIVLLDVMFKHPEIVKMGDVPETKVIKKFYIKVNKFLKLIENNFKKKIVVCIHPKDNLKAKEKIFNKYKVVKYATQKNIIESFIVLFFDTSAIVDAILLKKKIILLTTSLQGKNSMNVGGGYHKKVGIFKINLDNYEFKNKKTLLNQLNKSRINQLNYIKSYLAPDGNNLGFEKIIRIIKDRFF
ncbi:hypothetical protein N8086_02090, partial [Pelagibacteraceae bacterium]|nr:hypothetical protein [Pelagibacteraceae bacterium]